jgi:hypothetical protein
MGGRRAAFQLPEGPEFVFQEEAAARRRGWTENLQFYTGVGYLGGVLQIDMCKKPVDVVGVAVSGMSSAGVALSNSRNSSSVGCVKKCHHASWHLLSDWDHCGCVT